MAKLLLELGADVHISHDYVLINACKDSQPKTIKLLLQFGANSYTYDDKIVQYVGKSCTCLTCNKWSINKLGLETKERNHQDANRCRY